MAVDMFLKLTDIKGEAQDAKHKDEIDVLAWSWGASQSGTTHMGSGGGGGKVSIQDLSITKYVDLASTNLLQYLCSGKHIATADLVVRKAGDNPLEYVIINMKDVMVTSVSTGGSGGEDRLTENVTLNFSIVDVIYRSQDSTSGAMKTEMTTGWDIAENVKTS